MKSLTVKSSIIVAALLAVGFSGCAEKASCNTAKSVASVTKTDARDAQIAQLQAELAAAKNAPAKVITKTVQGESVLYPPNAEPGKCYARVLTPAKYEIKTEKVLAKEASEKVKVIPAKYGYKTEKILVKEASERIVPVPATYKTVTEKILVSPASERLVPVPAKYKTVTEKVLVSPATTTWRKGNRAKNANVCSTGDCEQVRGATGEVMCLVTTPAQYRTVTRKVLVSPATTKSVPVPAVYKTVTKKVIATPATTKTVPVPAVYKTVKVKTIVEPARTVTTPIPAVYKTVTKKIKVADSHLDWKEVKCKSVRY
jgi:regulator of extracellular matrix RemA (YlzA/DUF370 family)